LGEKRNAYLGLVRKPEGRRPLGRPNLRWENDIKMDILGIGWRVIDWIYLPQDRDHGRGLMNREWNFGFHTIFGNS
jgi:hypothetical protein